MSWNFFRFGSLGFVWLGGLGVATSYQQHVWLPLFCLRIKTPSSRILLIFLRPLYAPTRHVGRSQERARSGVLSHRSSPTATPCGERRSSRKAADSCSWFLTLCERIETFIAPVKRPPTAADGPSQMWHYFVSVHFIRQHTARCARRKAGEIMLYLYFVPRAVFGY